MGGGERGASFLQEVEKLKRRTNLEIFYIPLYIDLKIIKLFVIEVEKNVSLECKSSKLWKLACNKFFHYSQRFSLLRFRMNSSNYDNVLINVIEN